jgi:Uma2 family endonuclease
MKEYIDNGTKLGWLINPQDQKVEIYREDQEVEILEHPLILSGENILPNFVLNLELIW